MNNEILDKVDEIINKIETSELYKKYIDLQKKIENNKEIMLLINEVRVLQKDIVHHLDKKNELEMKQQELNNNPLYREYINTIDEINNTYNIIENSLNNYFYQKLND